MADLLTYKGAIYPWHCDHMGHMNVMWYVGKFDEATWRLFHALGLTPTFLRENSRGMAAVEQTFSTSVNCWPAISSRSIRRCLRSRTK